MRVVRRMFVVVAVAAGLTVVVKSAVRAIRIGNHCEPPLDAPVHAIRIANHCEPP
jgi:hypothetical protein